ncbi:class I SAM-dependent methyltransferase [Ilumatobacter nonamiensis]|uniref:class I SAM-dependent methyltransferase n=1 Tax=Ilumatobacter nonamiensis TaxID=467093 RepID=UPI000345D9E5|nr:class I SAM-dependent methyltransferase [Ilumatobacter nonamiensis]
MTDPATRELRAYYEHEAVARSRGAAAGRRIDAVEAFAVLLAAEGRGSVLDVGAGPATDAGAFTDRSIRYIGVDLAVGNGIVARERGHDVVAGSMFDLPFRPDSFDAGWSMSTLMHVPASDVGRVMREILRPLVVGAPIGIGVWGGPGRDLWSEPDDSGARRLFSLRTASRNRALLEEYGSIEHWEAWDTGPDGWEYHFAILRTPGPSGV